jgi:hypothetical protein
MSLTDKVFRIFLSVLTDSILVVCLLVLSWSACFLLQVSHVQGVRQTVHRLHSRCRSQRSADTELTELNFSQFSISRKFLLTNFSQKACQSFWDPDAFGGSKNQTCK